MHPYATKKKKKKRNRYLAKIPKYVDPGLEY